jgi:hypothetical protein
LRCSLALLTLLSLTALISLCSGVFWSGSVDNLTDGSSWSIYRYSDNFSFDLSSSVEGSIEAISVTPDGRIMSPYHQSYTDVVANDVLLKERTAALEGIYSSDEAINLDASVNDVDVHIIKPNNSGIWTIKWEENWPVVLNTTRTVDYAGLGINDRECIGNDLDAVSSSFLFNQELSKEREAYMRLERMNTTVVATNDTIIRADFMPTRSTDYKLESHSTGIADLMYRQINAQREIASYDEERYSGTYDISRWILMRSNFTEYEDETDWLSCSIGGCLDVPECDGVWNESRIFGCV